MRIGHAFQYRESQLANGDAARLENMAFCTGNAAAIRGVKVRSYNSRPSTLDPVYVATRDSSRMRNGDIL